MTEFEYNTTLNGGVITVVLEIMEIDDEDGIDYKTALHAVYHEGCDVTAILSEQTLSELEMEAEAGLSDYSFEIRNV
jgi:hypothetical protein